MRALAAAVLGSLALLVPAALPTPPAGYRTVMSGTATGDADWKLAARRIRLSGFPGLCVVLDVQPPEGLVVDDEPAAAREVLPALAAAIGAKPPRRVPRWLARLVAGEAGVVLMTEARGASNAKAKRELGWALRYPSWRQGFPAVYR